MSFEQPVIMFIMYTKQFLLKKKTHYSFKYSYIYNLFYIYELNACVHVCFESLFSHT